MAQFPRKRWMQELATKGDETNLRRDMEEMELRMTIKMGGMILASVGMIVGILRVYPIPAQPVYQPPAQEMHVPAPVLSPVTAQPTTAAPPAK